MRQLIVEFMLANTEHNIGIIRRRENMYKSQRTLFLCILLLTLIICPVFFFLGKIPLGLFLPGLVKS